MMKNKLACLFMNNIDINKMSIDSSVEELLKVIADVFCPDIEDLSDLELDKGIHRYTDKDGHTLFMPLNRNYFKSEERISALKNYLEDLDNNLDNGSITKVVRNNGELAIISIW